MAAGRGGTAAMLTFAALALGCAVGAALVAGAPRVDQEQAAHAGGAAQAAVKAARDGALDTLASDATAAAAIPQLGAAIRNKVDAFTLEDLFTSESWWAPYRSRAVNDPRGVLADFGVTLPADTTIRVWDSTAETRFIVLPMRPKGTDGWNEEKLASLVTRDSMIGTGFAKQPGEVA